MISKKFFLIIIGFLLLIMSTSYAIWFFFTETTIIESGVVINFAETAVSSKDFDNKVILAHIDLFLDPPIFRFRVLSRDLDRFGIGYYYKKILRGSRVEISAVKRENYYLVKNIIFCSATHGEIFR
jgi:hypothetical protein